MCGGCKVGPENWQCRQCGTVNAIRFSVKCSRCSHPLLGQMKVPILKPKSNLPQGG